MKDLSIKAWWIGRREEIGIFHRCREGADKGKMSCIFHFTEGAASGPWRHQHDCFYFNMRGYDQQVGRFLQSDLAVDKHLDLSPYNFVMNNPALYGDPSGMDTTVQSGSGGIVGLRLMYGG